MGPLSEWPLSHYHLTLFRVWSLPFETLFTQLTGLKWKWCDHKVKHSCTDPSSVVFSIPIEVCCPQIHSIWSGVLFFLFAYNMYSLVLLKLAPQRANFIFREKHIHLCYNATSMRSREYEPKIKGIPLNVFFVSRLYWWLCLIMLKVNEPYSVCLTFGV